LRVVRSAAEVRPVSWSSIPHTPICQVSEAKKKQTLKKRKEEIVVYSFSFSFHLFIYGAQYLQERVLQMRKSCVPPLALTPTFIFSLCSELLLHIPVSPQRILMCFYQLQSATSLKTVRRRSGSATTAVDRATSRPHARSSAASRPSNATRAAASATSKRNAPRSASRAPTKNATYAALFFFSRRGVG